MPIRNIHRKTPGLETPTQVFSCGYCEIFNPFKSTKYLVELETWFFNIFLLSTNDIQFLFEENRASRSGDNFWVTNDPMDVKGKSSGFASS